METVSVFGTRKKSATKPDNEQKEEEQEEIMELSASDDFLSDSSHDLDSDYIPLAPPSSENELTSSQSKLMKTHDALKNPGKTSLSQSYVHEQKTLMDSGKSNEALDMDCNKDTEEENPEEYEDDEGRSCVTVKTCTKGDKRKYDKRQYCVYCQKPLSKMARHLIRKHGNEKVAQATCLPKNSKKQQQIFELLRRKGNYYHNVKVLQEGKGEIVTYRRPTEQVEAEN
ncbi:uncharacterized protein [Nothobranchius furzeri]|uniref:uncharacterized protein n=1 Tax=Nothobranchius furzeri TaxID=105023 RepID=UPI002403DF09|nr:uncharacterized protein LOC129163703 isoform X1 [Nothobranchius furzeri]XP_054600808.1 uncharacterized protein LOC129164475 isoform X1 [Nothobranchius furzeri]